MFREVAEYAQVLFLTCHESRVALVREVFGEVEPIVLSAGEGVLPAKKAIPWVKAEESPGRRRGVFGTADLEAGRKFRAEGFRVEGGAKSDIPGKEPSLRRRPGPL